MYDEATVDVVAVVVGTIAVVVMKQVPGSSKILPAPLSAKIGDPLITSMPLTTSKPYSPLFEYVPSITLIFEQLPLR
jgi:hypothetical protein